MQIIAEVCCRFDDRRKVGSGYSAKINSNSINFRLEEIYAASIGGYVRNNGNDIILLIVRHGSYFASFEAIVATCFP